MSSMKILWQPKAPVALRTKKTPTETIVNCLQLSEEPKMFKTEDCAFLQGVSTMVPEVKDLVNAIMDHGAITVWANK